MNLSIRRRRQAGKIVIGTKLTEQAVRHIRTSNLSINQLARIYNVSTTAVWAARNRFTWKRI